MMEHTLKKEYSKSEKFGDRVLDFGQILIKLSNIH